MANNKVKLKVSIKELVFEYEGDNERAQVLQGRITETLGTLAAAQADAIDISPARQLPAAPVIPSPRRRRRSRKLSTDGDESGSGSQQTDTAGEDKSSRRRRTRGTSYRAQVSSLMNEGFFQTKRSGEEVRAELIRRGHNFGQNRINDALLALTQSKRLSREMNDNVWEYENNKA